MDNHQSAELQRVKTAHRQLPDIVVGDQFKGWKIMGLVADNSACGYYRIILPLHMLRMLGADVNYTSFHQGDAFGKYDVILAPRQHNPEVLEVLRHGAWEGKLFVYEIDDDLHHVEPSNPAYSVYHQGTEECRMIPEFLKSAHGWTTTTPELARLYYQYNRNPVVIDNFIDYSFRDWGMDVQWEEGGPVLTPLPLNRPAEWEGKIVLAWSGGTCFDDQTEILTETRGWQLFKNLDSTDKVATMNPETKFLEYQLPTEYTTVPYEGKLNTANTPQVNFAVTPNHWMYVSKAKSRSAKALDFELIQSEKIHGQRDFYCKKNALWIGESDGEYFTLPAVVSGKYNTPIPERRIHKQEWARFFGFWLADGYVSKSPNLHHVGLTQAKSKDILDEMASLLEGWGYHVNWTRNDTEIRVCNKQLWSYLAQFGDALSKYIPQDIKNWERGYLYTLYGYFMKGDGHIESDTGRERLWTSSKQMADDWTEIALKCGWAANTLVRAPREQVIIEGREVNPSGSSYQVTILRDGNRNFLNPVVLIENQDTIDYNGTVYCVTVPNHIIYVRREGKPMWCGNTHKEDLEQVGPAICHILRDNPQVTFAFYGSWDMYQWILSTFSIPVDRTSYVKARHFMDYPSGLHGFDISLAPIACNQFNLCKSYLRIEEYLAVGSACVASNVGPYARWEAKHPDSVVLVGQGSKCVSTWLQAIQQLVDDEPRRKQMQETGRQLIMEEYSLEKNVYRWPLAWAAIADQRTAGLLGSDPVKRDKTWYKAYGQAGRNDPCPCGSGLKYKECHIGAWG